MTLNYLPPPDISFSPTHKSITDTQIKIYNSIPSLTLHFKNEDTVFHKINRTTFNNTIITDTLALNMFSYYNHYTKKTITYSDLMASNGFQYYFKTGYISFSSIQNLIIDESLNTFIIPSTYYRLYLTTTSPLRYIHLHKSIGITFYICYPPRVQQDPIINLSSRQIAITFSKDISFNKDISFTKNNISIINNNTYLKYRDCKIINKTLYIDFSNFNKYTTYGTYTILIKNNAITSISNYYSQPLEEDYSFNFYIPEYKCLQPCVPRILKTNLKGFPGGTLMSTHNDYGSHNATAIKYSKQVINPTSYKNPGVIVKTSHKRVIPKISNF